jgi:hypothetical protein
MLAGLLPLRNMLNISRVCAKHFGQSITCVAPPMAGQHMEGAHDDGMRRRHDGALLPLAGGQALIQGRQVGPLGPGEGMGQLRQISPASARSSRAILAHIRPLASSGIVAGSARPWIYAAKIARPDTPMMSVATAAGLILVCSNTPWTRLTSRLRSYTSVVR